MITCSLHLINSSSWLDNHFRPSCRWIPWPKSNGRLALAGWIFSIYSETPAQMRNQLATIFDAWRNKSAVSSKVQLCFLFSLFLVCSYHGAYRESWAISLARMRRGLIHHLCQDGRIAHGIAPLRAISFRLFKIYTAGDRTSDAIGFQFSLNFLENIRFKKLE